MFNLSELTGTEKQVSYANEIRTAQVNELRPALEGEVWGNPDAKSLWAHLTDDGYKAAEIRLQIDEQEKAVRVEAQKQARAEYREWMIAVINSLSTAQQWIDGEGHVGQMRERFAVKYWNRVAELCGIN